MNIEIYDKLNFDIRKIRTKVFIEEQGFEVEFDEKDDISKHLLLYEQNKPVAVSRIYFSKEKSCFIIGRIAVLKEYRKRGFGALMISFAQEYIKNNGGTCICLMAQKAASKFYQKLGFVEFGEIVYDEFCPHIWMKKNL